MESRQIYAARSSAVSSVTIGRFYVFEEHIVYRTNDGTFAVDFDSIELDDHGVRRYPNAVKGFLELRHEIRSPIVPMYEFIGEISVTDLEKIRKRLKKL